LRERYRAVTENEIAREVVDAAFKIHSRIGPGLLESAYEAMLVHELRKRGLEVAQQVAIPIVYDGSVLEVGFRADVIVGGKVYSGVEVGRGRRAGASEAAADVSAAGR